MAIVTSVTAIGDIAIAITSPAALSVPMRTNGEVIKVVTSAANVPTDVDLTKITLTVTDQGHNSSGTQVAVSRTITMREHLRGPYNETGYYQAVAGTFHFVLDDYVYNQDATWKTTITEVAFAAGWVPGATGESITVVTRADSLAYLAFPIKVFSHPFDRIATGGSYALEALAIHPYARNNSQVACFEAWGVDSAATVGTLVRGATLDRSPSTPASGVSVPGVRADTYAMDVPMTGLVQGRVGIRIVCKPWIGPPVTAFTYGDAWPTINLAREIPVYYDTDGSHAQVFGVLANDPASPPSGKTVLGVATSVATADCSGLSLSIAGATGSNKIYPTLASFLWAARKFNASAVNVTTADGSIKRAVAHDDTSSACAVCPPVSGSTLGANLGAYSVRTAASSQTNFPPGACPVEIRSLSGLPTTDVRWRGVLSEGGTPASKTVPARLRLRGLTVDSTGVTIVADNIAMDQGGADVVLPTEAAAKYMLRVDTIIREVDPAALSTTASAAVYRPGHFWDRRVAHYDPQSQTAMTGSSVNFGGMAASIGSYYGKSSGGRLSGVFATAAGVRLFNVGIVAQAGGTAGSGGIPKIVQPLITGFMLYNVFVETPETSPSSALISWNTFHPVRKGAGICMVFGYAPSATAYGGPMFAFGNDGTRTESDGFIIQHLGGDCPLLTDLQFSDARINFGYNDQSANRIDKYYFGQYIAVRNWNTKGDDFAAPETVPSTAYNATDAYYKGAVVISGGTARACIKDVPYSSGIAVTDAAYWFDLGLAAGTVWGQRSLRQGNSGSRYHIGYRGNVGCGTFNAEGVTPGPSTPIGLKWGPDEKPNATYANFYSARGTDYRAKAGGELVNRIAAGAAVTPYYLSLTNANVALKNDGTDPAGVFEANGRSTNLSVTLTPSTMSATTGIGVGTSAASTLAAGTIAASTSVGVATAFAATLRASTLAATTLVGGGSITTNFSATLAPSILSATAAGQVGTSLSLDLAAASLDGAILVGVATGLSAALAGSTVDATFTETPPPPIDGSTATPALLKSVFPVFVNVPNETVQFWIDRAARSVDHSWSDGDRVYAQLLLAAHLMTEQGLGGGAEAEMAAAGAAGFKVMKSGSLTLERDTAAADAGPYGTTAYGRQFAVLLRQNKGGARVTDGGTLPVPLFGHSFGRMPGW